MATLFQIIGIKVDGGKELLRIQIERGLAEQVLMDTRQLFGDKYQDYVIEEVAISPAAAPAKKKAVKKVKKTKAKPKAKKKAKAKKSKKKAKKRK